MAADAPLTPMMAQYRRIKAELPRDALLLFRLGDFYEMFFEDAQVGARVLNLTLTARQGVPMCGLPYHAASGYIARLLRAGHKVALCDQLEVARPGKLVHRQVTQILSPGAHFDERLLAAERNNFLAAVTAAGSRHGLALLDLTTADFRATELESDQALLAELERVRPAEVVIPAEAAALRQLLQGTGAALSAYDDWAFAPETAQFTVRDHFQVATLDGFGLNGRLLAIGAAGAALHYVTHHLRRDARHVTRLRFYQAAEYLVLDATTLRNLEVLEPLHRGAPRTATLYGAINRTVTPMGARRLRDWLSQPLASVPAIRRRQDAVEALLADPPRLESLRAALQPVRDLERTLARLSVGTGNARDLVALRLALQQVPQVRAALDRFQAWVNPEDSPGTALLREGGFSEHPPAGFGFFGPIFPQFRGEPEKAIAWLRKVRCGEAPGALHHPEVGEIDLVWGSAGKRGSGFGLAKIEAGHPEMLVELPGKIASMRKVRETANTLLLASADQQAVVRLNAFGHPKRWLLTAYETQQPATAGRTLDVSGAGEMSRQTPTSRGGPHPALPPDSPGVNPPPQALHDGSSRPDSTASLPESVGTDLPLLAELTDRLSECPDLADLIARAIVDDPPLALKEGGLIRDGYDPALDELRAAMRGGKDWIARLQRDEIARTGIPSLKVGFNSVFGYYIEVTRANLDKVPPDYIRKQTIANGERFITPALKEMEAKILGAEERAARLEYELFLRVREAALGRLRELQQTAEALGELDVLAAFAEQARLHNYCRPEIGDAGRLWIREGRHPVLELTLTEERFVPNDTDLAAATSPPAGDSAETPPAAPAAEAGAAPEGRSPKTESAEAAPQIALITGPNMAGKSTYLRQVALLVLLAHTGSFIPARAARVDLVDRIFTRIGASDDLARGQSTFMVEMAETANILHHATPRSLIILDEIGRGTSTFDGLSLAWSIVEHLHHQIGARTLFATHYHELTELAAKLPRLRNYNVAVREWNDQIIFLRRIVPGGTDKSYGLQVARLAGVPKPVIERAKVILRNLEESELTPEGTVRRAARHRAERDKLRALEPPAQLDLFG
jgi:DNA mismatch repair ATPase MutS